MPHLVNLRVNGEDMSFYVEPDERLLDTLRGRLGLRSVREGCGTGDCGSCTVLLNGRPVLSCLMLTIQADGSDVLTVEGLSKDGGVHPLQRSFVDEGAVRCGYCTPAMLLSAKALLDGNPDPSDDEIRDAISGVICRCTGYYSVMRAIRRASKEMRGSK
ncbi:MAG: (2Fe-2S)-binding protein [Nitrososphaeria archaeon]